MFKRSITGLFVRFAGALINFGLTVFLARNMLKNEFGTYQYFVVIVSGLSLVARVGMDTYFLVNIPAEKSNKKISFILQQATIIAILTSILLVVTVGSCYSFIKNIHSTETRIHLVMLASAIPQCIYLLNSAFEKALGNMTSALLTSFMFFPLCMFAVVFSAQQYSLNEILIFYLTSNIIVMLISIFITYKNIDKFKLKSIKSIYILSFFKKGFAYLPHSIMNYILLWIDVGLVGLLLTAEWVAEYSVASRVTLIILLAMSVYDGLFSPKIIKSYKENTLSIFVSDIRLIFLRTVFFVIFFVAITLFSSNYIIHLFGDSYHSAADCAYILILAYGLRSFSSLPGYVLIAMGKISLINIILMLSMLVTVSVSVFLINKYQIIGVAFGTLAASSFIVFFNYIFMFFQINKLKNAL